MAYKKAYEPIKWVNRTTPSLSAENLNDMDNAINTLDDYMVELSKSHDTAETNIASLRSELDGLKSANSEAHAEMRKRIIDLQDKIENLELSGGGANTSLSELINSEAF